MRAEHEPNRHTTNDCNFKFNNFDISTRVLDSYKLPAYLPGFARNILGRAVVFNGLLPYIIKRLLIFI